MVAISAIFVGGLIGISGLLDFFSEQEVEVEIVSDDGIVDPYGAGKYYKGHTVTLSTYVAVGWFFDGWYDSEDKLLSEDLDYSFTAKGSCTVYAKTTRGYGIDVYQTAGIKNVTGGGTYELKDNAILTAETYPGYTFKGWYDLEGNKVSPLKTLYLDKHEDRMLIARTTAADPYSGTNQMTIESATGYQDDSTFMCLVDKRTSELAAVSTGTQGWTASLAPGQYQLVIKGLKEDGTHGEERKTIMVDGIASCVYHWNFEKKTYTLVWDIDTTVYDGYVENTSGRAPVSDKDRIAFVNYTSDEMKYIAGKLSELSSSMDLVERANFVLKFVQLCTDYEYDYRYNGEAEYWKYPIETLFEGRGDCEDTTVLYCALMKALGYQSAMLLFLGPEYDVGHAAGSVALESVPGGTYYAKDGLHFYYCETTSDIKNVGDPWEKYDRGEVLVIP